MIKQKKLALACLCTLLLALCYFYRVDLEENINRTSVLRIKEDENIAEFYRLLKRSATEQKDFKQIEIVTTIFHQRLALQHEKFNLPFRIVDDPTSQSICIVSMHEYSSGVMQLLNRNLTQNKRDFASQYQNMGYIEVDASHYRQKFTTLSSTWLKLPALRDIIASDTDRKYEWYMWVDADVIFTNNSCAFQELLSSNHRVIVASDFNSGVFFIRNHPWSIAFLDAWFSTWPTLQFALGQEDEAYSALLFDSELWSRHIYAAPASKFPLIVSYPSVIEDNQPASWHVGHCVLHVAGFHAYKASIVYACLHSEYKCVQRLNQVYVEHNSTAYLQLSASLSQEGYG